MAKLNTERGQCGCGETAEDDIATESPLHIYDKIILFLDLCVGRRGDAGVVLPICDGNDQHGVIAEVNQVWNRAV